MKKKILIIMTKKKKLCRKIEVWATAQVYCKARLLGVQALGRRWARAECAGRAGEGAGVGAGNSARGAQAAAARAGSRTAGRAGAQAAGR